ncbi:hypothetical protein Bca52824_045383 [Brassica carinata]|uniref:Uncharacterized protein n=1 Tax=Brassica carinata TaxID=52824 RepID=A0A8X7UP88_BRACI|nr:hypothetical protein Bca52824_045383 [Brassica carinata]
MTKREYEELVQKVEDATGNSYWLDAGDDFEAFSNTKPSDHSTIVKVIWENEEGVGDEKEHGGSRRDVEHIAYLKSSKYVRDLVELVVCGDYRMGHVGCGD